MTLIESIYCIVNFKPSSLKNSIKVIHLIPSAIHTLLIDCFFFLSLISSVTTITCFNNGWFPAVTIVCCFNCTLANAITYGSAHSLSFV